MNAINYARIARIDKLPEAEKITQLTAITCLIETATPDELREFEMQLRRYRGNHKKDWEACVRLRKEMKPFIKLKETNTRENIPSFWRFLRFWDSSQQGQEQPKIQNKQQKISQQMLQLQPTLLHQKEKILQFQHQQQRIQQILQEKDQHLPAKKILHSHKRSQGPSQDGLLSELCQPLLCEPMDSVKYADVSNQRAKQKKTWIDLESFSCQLKKN